MEQQLFHTEQQLMSQSPSPARLAGQLMDAAEQLASSGDVASAILYVERAKSHEKENPTIWFQLARYNSMLHRYRRAESCALRTIRFASDDIQLQVKGWRLIEHVRLLSGDDKNSHYAANRANELEKKLIVSHN